MTCVAGQNRIGTKYTEYTAETWQGPLRRRRWRGYLLAPVECSTYILATGCYIAASPMFLMFSAHCSGIALIGVYFGPLHLSILPQSPRRPLSHPGNNTMTEHLPMTYRTCLRYSLQTAKLGIIGYDIIERASTPPLT